MRRVQRIMITYNKLNYNNMKSGDTEVSNFIDTMFANFTGRRHSSVNPEFFKLFKDTEEVSFAFEMEKDKLKSQYRRRSMNDYISKYLAIQEDEEDDVINSRSKVLFGETTKKGGRHTFPENLINPLDRPNIVDSESDEEKRYIKQQYRQMASDFIGDCFDRVDEHLDKLRQSKKFEENLSRRHTFKPQEDKVDPRDQRDSKRFSFGFEGNSYSDDENYNIQGQSFCNNLSMLEEATNRRESVKSDRAPPGDHINVDHKRNSKRNSILSNKLYQFDVSSPKDNKIEEFNNKAKNVSIKDSTNAMTVRPDILGKDYQKYIAEKAFVIQRAFRKFLIKKYDLPDNYFYLERFIKVQNEKYEKDVLENLKYIFPNFQASVGSVAHLPTHGAYEDEKIHLFAKILDLDIMVNNLFINRLRWTRYTTTNGGKPLTSYTLIQLKQETRYN
jgi:hypothetical protein